MLVAFLLMACKDTDDTDTDPPGPSWSVAFDASDRGDQSGVWGSGPADVYVVGGTPDEGTITHWNGTEWSPVALPGGVPLLVWVYGFGPNDVWSVGVDGAVVHFDGSSWEVRDAGTTEALWGVWGAGPDDMWVVGGDVAVGDPLLLHWDGTGFTPVPLEPSQNDRGAKSMFKVWGMAGRVFSVGQGGLIIEWDGTQWSQMSTGPSADQDFVSLWGTPDDGIFAVGGRSGARVAELDGQAWNTEAPAGYPGLNAVSVIDGDVLVGGQYGFVGRWEGGALVQETGAADTQADIHAMWSDGAGRTYGVGGTFQPPYDKGMAWVREMP